MAEAAKCLFVYLDNAGYEVSLERLKIYVARQTRKLGALGTSGLSTNQARTTYTGANVLSRQISRSPSGAQSCKPPIRWFKREVVHKILILVRYFASGYAMSTQASSL